VSGAILSPNEIATRQRGAGTREAVRYLVNEIPFRPRGRRIAWPLLLGLLALILALGFLFGKKRVTKPGIVTDSASSATTSATSTGSVAETANRRPYFDR
jgi:hypothetical protein